jgi:hypothetical protein
LVVHEVFEVLYSPVKAFKKIIEKPDFKALRYEYTKDAFSSLKTINSFYRNLENSCRYWCVIGH